MSTHRLEIGDVLCAHGGWGSYEELTVVAVTEETATLERRWMQWDTYPNGGKPFKRENEHVKSLVFWRDHKDGTNEINNDSVIMDGPPANWFLKK